MNKNIRRQLIMLSKRLINAFLIQLFLCTVILANPGSAQRKNIEEVKISMNLQEKSLAQFFKQVESKTDFKFTYTDNLVDLKQPITVVENNKSLYDVLVAVSMQTHLNFVQVNQNIHVKRLKSNNKEKAVEIVSKADITVRGTVIDDSGEPIPGVTVLVKGTTTGTATDLDGTYTINVDEGSTLVFSFIGFISQEINVGNRSTIDVRLQENVSSLGEVVVLGYGTVQRKDLTGAVGSVKSDDIKDLSITRVEQALLGKVAGVQVKAVSGEPGVAPQIRVRGVGSISAGVDPLYVVDGFPIDNLQMINPNDIESIDVLKDASATAIYGSRGSNGVVIITTKRGTEGKANISFNSYFGFQQVEKIPKMKNSMEQAHWFYDGMKNRNLDQGADVSGDPTQWRFQVPDIIMDILEGRNTMDVEPLNSIFVTAPQKQYQLTATGGTENIKYAISGEYMDQDGIVVNSNFKRYSLRTNIDAKLTNRLKAKLNLNPSYTQHVSLPVTGEGCCLGSNIVAAGLQIHNFYPMLNEDGSYFNFDGLTALAGVYNPLAVANETQTMQQRMRILGNIDLEYSILDELKFNVMVGGSLLGGKGMRFRPSLDVFFNEPATGRDEASFIYNWLTEYTLNYQKSFGLHNFTGLAGYTMQKESGFSNAIESNRYPNNMVPTLNAASAITFGTSNVNEWSLISYLARINYNYKNKYFITTSVRTDGSSRFGRENKYSTFPSIGLAWQLGDENIFKNVDFISMLKVRASYGESGNNNIGNYQHYATINYQNYPFGGGVVGGIAPAQLANPNLTWETQKQYNLGLDVEVFSGRINFTLDHFQSVNSDLLLNVNVPSITGYTNALQNIGEVKNQGWEFSVNTKNLVGKIVWETAFNISAYRNEVTKLGPTGDPIFAGDNVTMIGQPLGMFWGFLTDGVFMNQAELDAGPIYNPGANDRSRVGDIRFVDINGDGIIDNADNTFIGNPYPDFYYGMTNNISYKNLSLTISLQGTQGNEVLSRTRDAGNSGRARVRGYQFSNNYWKSEQDPGDGITPRPNDAPTGGPRRPNQNWVDDGSFMRITNITLGYLLPGKISNKLALSSLRVYTTATNPFLFTSYYSFNPDASFRGDPLRPGNEANDYPLGKGLLIGLNASF